SSRRRHTRWPRDWSSDVCSSDLPMGHSEGYILPQETIFNKIQETIDLGGTGILMQGGLHPDLKIEWYEDLLRSIKKRFDIWCHRSEERRVGKECRSRWSAYR